MSGRPSIHYSELYLATIVFVAGLVVATLVQVSASTHELLDFGVVLVTFGLLVVWIRANAGALKATRMQGWRHRPPVLGEPLTMNSSDKPASAKKNVDGIQARKQG